MPHKELQIKVAVDSMLKKIKIQINKRPRPWMS